MTDTSAPEGARPLPFAGSRTLFLAIFDGFSGAFKGLMHIIAGPRDQQSWWATTTELYHGLE